MLERGAELILKLTAPDRLATGTGAGRIARLYHEALDHTMEQMPVVVAVLAVHAEIFHRFRALLATQAQVNVTHRRVQYRIVVDLLHAWV